MAPPRRSLSTRVSVTVLSAHGEVAESQRTVWLWIFMFDDHDSFYRALIPMYMREAPYYLIMWNTLELLNHFR